MTRYRSSFFLWFFFLFLLSGRLTAGWIISEVSTDRFGNKSYRSTFIDRHLIRYESSFSIAIIDLEKDTVTMMFPGERAYWQGTADDLKNEIRAALLKQMDRFLAEIPKEDIDIYKDYFEKLKERLNAADSSSRRAEVFFKPLNTGDTIGGFYASVYHVFLDSLLVEKVWITNEVRPYQNTDLKILMETTAKMTPFDKEITINNSEDYISLIQKGLVVKTEKLLNAKPYYTTTVTYVKEGNIPASFFRPTDGYKKVRIFDVVNMSEASLLPDLKTPFDDNNAGPFDNPK
jgi:hypothetical protein